MNAEFGLELLEPNHVLLFVLSAALLPSLFDVSVTQLVAGVAFEDLQELVEFHLLAIAEFSENLIERSADTVEQLLDDFVDGVGTLPLLDSEKLLIIICHVVNDPRLDNRIADLSVRIDVVFELTEQLLDRADLSVPVETDLLQHTF